MCLIANLHANGLRTDSLCQQLGSLQFSFVLPTNSDLTLRESKQALAVLACDFKVDQVESGAIRSALYDHVLAITIRAFGVCHVPTRLWLLFCDSTSQHEFLRPSE